MLNVVTSSARLASAPQTRWNRGKLYSNLSYLTMILPGAIWLFLFAYLPMPGIIMAFKTDKLVKPPADAWMQNRLLYRLNNSPWAGLDNFNDPCATRPAPVFF